MGRRMMVLHSALAPDSVVEVLRGEVDREADMDGWSLFPVSEAAGDGPVYGAIEGRVMGDRFRLRRKGYILNDFGGQFYGRMGAEPGGTRIEGYFDFPRWVRSFMRAWLVVALAAGVPIFGLTVMDMVNGTRRMGGGGEWVGLVVAPLFLAYALLLPWLGRWLGRGGERYILHFIETKLVARRS